MTPEEVAEVYTMRVEAELAPNYDHRCIYGEKVFFVPTKRAFAPGQIYSDMGIKEYHRNSHCCEFHFDWMFADEDLVDL